jgi:hypothetical protein
MLCFVASTHADDHKVSAVKVDSPKFAGVIDDPAWGQAPTITGFVDQASGHPVQDQTIVRIAYDAKYIYVAFDCRDSQPDKIMARETIRDSKYQNQTNGETEDNVELRLDAFKSRKQVDLSRFSVNAIGTPSAALAGGRGNKAEWKGDYIASAKKTATGWYGQMQIPWASLNYPRSSVPIEMGINFYRFQCRTNITSMWSNTGMLGLLDQEGYWTGVQVPSTAFQHKLSLLPYVLGGADTEGGSIRGGLDARYALTPELTAVGTLKPDFSTVEGAVEGIQFSRTERYVPDLRPFFLEGANFLSVPLKYSGIGNFFYPDRIQSFDVGTNVYGKIAPKDTLGFLDAYSFTGRNDVITRYSHNFGPNANTGFFLAQKTSPGDDNTLASFDYHNKWGKAGFEDINATTQGQFAGGGASIENLTYEDKLLLWDLEYADLSNNFNSEDSYFPQVGYKGWSFVNAWFNFWQHGYFKDFQIVDSAWYNWHSGGQVFQSGTDIQAYVDSRSDTHYSVEYTYNRYDASTDQTVTLGFLRGTTNRFCQWGLGYQFGMLGNEPASFITPTFSFRVLKKLDLNYSGSILNLGGVTQQHIFTANYELSPTKSIGGRVVSQTGGTNGFLYYHNSGGKGTEVYFLLGDPNALKFRKQIELKFIFALGSK